MATDNKPQVAAAKASATKPARSATALGGGLGVVILGALFALFGLFSQTPALTFFSAMAAAIGAFWFAWGVYLFAENVDHIAHKI